MPITQNTTCPTCRTPFIAPRAGDEQRARQDGDPHGAGEADFAAFLNNEVTRAFEVFSPAPAAPTSAGPRRDGQTSSDEDSEQMEEAEFEYDHDRSEFSGMYS